MHSDIKSDNSSDTSTVVRDLVVRAIEDLKGTDVKVFNVSTLTDITDYMVIATGRSRRQVMAVAEEVVRQSKEADHTPLGVEGMDAGEWVLVDLNYVVCHIMQPETREFYQLEKLWDAHLAAKEPKALGHVG